jgi:hypothetical protein
MTLALGALAVMLVVLTFAALWLVERDARRVSEEATKDEG